MDKKYLINIFICLVTGVLALSLIAFVIYHLTGLDSVSYTTAVAVKENAEIGFEGEGWIFRSEIPLAQDIDGTFYSTLQDGENVAKGKTIGAVYERNGEVKERLNEIDRILSILKKANVSTTLKDSSAKVRALTAEMRSASAQGNALSQSALEDELIAALDRRRAAAGAVSGYNSAISSLEKEKAELLERLGVEKQELLAPKAGNYHKTCDGYEQYFSFDFCETLDPASFSALLDSLGDPAPAEGGKLVDSSVWKLVMLTQSDNALQLTAGKTYTLSFDAAGKMQMKLERISADPQSAQTLLVFSSRINPPAALSRCEHLRVVSSTQSGLRVPTGAVRYFEETGAVGVYILDGNKIKIKKVEILSKTQGFYIVAQGSEKDQLKENDIILTGGKNLAVGYAV